MRETQRKQHLSGRKYLGNKTSKSRPEGQLQGSQEVKSFSTRTTDEIYRTTDYRYPA
jgi:hypothetical protein